MNTRPKRQLGEIFRYLVGALIVAPVTGGVVGIVAALAFASVMSLGSREPFDGPYILWVAVTHGPVFGVPPGLLLGVLTGWPLRNLPPLRTVAILSGSTLAGAVPFCFMGPLCIMTALAGYAIGLNYLIGTEQKKRRLQPAGTIQ